MINTDFLEIQKLKGKSVDEFNKMFEFVLGKNDVTIQNESIKFKGTYDNGPDFISDVVNYIYKDEGENIIKKYYDLNNIQYITNEETKNEKTKKKLTQEELGNLSLYRKIENSNYYIYIKGSGPDKIGKVTDLLSDYCKQKKILLQIRKIISG